TIEWIPVESAGQMVCLGSSATTPAMPYRINGQGRQMLAAAALPADFPSKQLVTPKQVTFKSEDGLEIHGQLFVPAERRQAGPALIFVHGGPIRQMMLGFHYMYYYHNAYAMNQYLAIRGYVVLSVNYRLGIMYGRAFREAANAGWRGSSEYKDVVAGAKYLQSLPIVAAKRIGLAQRRREQKVYFEELIFPDEIHDFLIWRNWVRAYKASVDFFAEELGQRASGGKP